LEPFLVVTPSAKSPHAAEQEWIEFELKHFLTRWKALMRGEARVKKDVDVTDDDIKNYHLVAFGDVKLNRSRNGSPGSYIPEVILKAPEFFRFGDRNYERGKYIPVMIYPNPLNPKKYVVLNSGLTFREVHDKTNSQQNPKLPDWAIIDITQPPNASAPGKIVDAGFFDEWWKVKQRLQ
jgi:hypothetical protein